MLIPLPKICRIETAVFDGDLVEVENGSEACFASGAGSTWVRKRHANTGFQPLLAECISFLMGGYLGVKQPHSALYWDPREDDWSWLSEVVTGVHWSPDMCDYIINKEEVAAMIVLDALVANDDRHLRNIIAEVSGDEFGFTLWAIDNGKALVAYPEDFLSLGLNPPDPRNHARGLPVEPLTHHAMEVASKAFSIDPRELQAYVEEACEVVQETKAAQIGECLYKRCQNAEDIVQAYLDKLVLI